MIVREPGTLSTLNHPASVSSDLSGDGVAETPGRGQPLTLAALVLLPGPVPCICSGRCASTDAGRDVA